MTESSLAVGHPSDNLIDSHSVLRQSCRKKPVSDPSRLRELKRVRSDERFLDGSISGGQQNDPRSSRVRIFRGGDDISVRCRCRIEIPSFFCQIMDFPRFCQIHITNPRASAEGPPTPRHGFAPEYSLTF